MKGQKLIKTFADKDCNVYNLIKANGEDSYFMEVLYYYVRRSLLRADFDLSEYEAFTINGKYFGFKLEVNFGSAYNNVIQSLSFALSVRALMLNPSYLQYCYDSRLLFFTMTEYLSWESHRIILECINDEDFRFIYQMIVDTKDKGKVDDKNKQLFEEKTIRPEFHHLEDYCKLMAKDPEYNGKSVIKNNAYLCSDIEEFTITKAIDYVGDTVFAYCDNLKEIRFERKVLFGKFPIIECKNLQRIIVPTEFLDYYKAELAYYKYIICDQEHLIEIKEEEKCSHVETVEKVDNSDDLEIEHVYVDSLSADPYVETEEAPDALIDYSKIGEIFEKKASSYKYFWFLSIISLANERNQLKVTYKDIVIRMAAMAWPMIFEDEINLGKRDMISQYLSAVEKATKLIPAATSKVVENYLTQHYQSQGIDRILSPLLKNVPYRFLSPWVRYTSDDDVIMESNRRVFSGLYALNKEGILLNETWWNYIQENYRDICKQAIDSFEDYLKDNNNGMALLKFKVGGVAFIGKT